MKYLQRNADDEHINGMFRDVIDQKCKRVTVVQRDSERNPQTVKKEIAYKLKVISESNISVILVDDDRKRNGISWIDCFVAANGEFA